jgi:hypothetical protein
MVYEKLARVQALATLFDVGTEDAQGLTYSQKRVASGLGCYCFGTILRVYRMARNVPQKYTVKWDEGSSTCIEERHLSLVPDGEAGGSSVTTADDEATGMSDHLTRDAEVTDDEDEDIDVEGAVPVDGFNALADLGEAVITPLNGVVQCGEFRWRRVKAIAPDPRTNHTEFDFSLRNVSLTETTSLNELFWLCMPVSRSDLLATVRFRAGAPPKPVTLTLTSA